jgi:hypothetical protein
MPPPEPPAPVEELLEEELAEADEVVPVVV